MNTPPDDFVKTGSGQTAKEYRFEIRTVFARNRAQFTVNDSDPWVQKNAFLSHIHTTTSTS